MLFNWTMLLGTDWQNHHHHRRHATSLASHLGPAYLLYEVREVSLHRQVVHPCPQVTVEMFIIRRVLLQHKTVPQHEVGEPVRCHGTIHVHLVLELAEEGGQYRQKGVERRYSR